MSLPRIYPFHESHFQSRAVDAPGGSFAEPTLSYQPPYGREVDDQMAWFLVRHLYPQAGFEHDVRIGSAGRTVRLDFLVTRGSQRVGFIVNDSEEQRDEQQECYQMSRLVASGALDVVYAFYGPRLEGRMADCLSVVAGWHPSLFSPDGLAGLAGRAARISRSFSLHGTGSEVRLYYQHPSLDDHYGGERFVWPDEAPEQVLVRRFGIVRTRRRVRAA